MIFFFNSNQLNGKKVMVTAGPTYEAIDPVRFIGNHSSGKMGIAIATEFKKRGAEVTLIIGPTQIDVPVLDKVIKVTSSDQMYKACNDVFQQMDIAIMNAAVADYTPVIISEEKIKKEQDTFLVELKKTKDILKHLGEIKKHGQFLVGFALETNNEKEYALKKLESKNADMIVLNSLNDAGAGFGYNTNKITIFDRSNNEYYFDIKSKTDAATDIVNTIIKLLYA